MKVFLFCFVFILFNNLSFGSGNIEVESFITKCSKNYVGENASVFFVSARRPFLNITGGKLRVREVFKRIGPLLIKPSSDGAYGVINIPKTKFYTEHFKLFNYIYFVIHDYNQSSVIL